jgi:hypothetical protein
VTVVAASVTGAIGAAVALGIVGGVRGIDCIGAAGTEARDRLAKTRLIDDDATVVSNGIIVTGAENCLREGAVGTAATGEFGAMARGEFTGAVGGDKIGGGGAAGTRSRMTCSIVRTGGASTVGISDTGASSAMDGRGVDTMTGVDGTGEGTGAAAVGAATFSVGSSAIFAAGFAAGFSAGFFAAFSTDFAAAACCALTFA